MDNYQWVPLNNVKTLLYKELMVNSITVRLVFFFKLSVTTITHLNALKSSKHLKLSNENKNPETSWPSHVPTDQWIPHHQPAEAWRLHSAEPLGWRSEMREVLESLPHPWVSTCPAAPVLALPLVLSPSWHILRILSKPEQKDIVQVISEKPV